MTPAVAVRRRKRDLHGLTLRERQRLAFIAGVVDAARKHRGPVYLWFYRGSGSLVAYSRGAKKGAAMMAELLDWWDHVNG